MGWKEDHRSTRTNPAIRVRGSPNWGGNGMRGLVFNEKVEGNQIWTPFFDMSSRHGDALDMAEFKAIVTASFDDIAPNVAFDNIRALYPTRLAPPSSDDRPTRRSPLSFLRKVKSHATSLLVSQSRPESAPPSSSFVPSLLPSRQPAPAPFVPRNLLTRALGKHTHVPHVPDLEPKSCFFDDDEEGRRLYPRISSSLSSSARPNPRFSSAFATAPIFFGLSSPSASTPYLVAEKHDAVRPDSSANIVHVCAHLLLDPLP
jgi:hypothetical protein